MTKKAEIKHRYIIVGDDNYWYASTDEVTKKELAVVIKQTKAMIKKGNQFMPTPASEPNELYAYPVGESIQFKA